MVPSTRIESARKLAQTSDYKKGKKNMVPSNSGDRPIVNSLRAKLPEPSLDYNNNENRNQEITP